MVFFSKHAISSLLAGWLILSLEPTVVGALPSDGKCSGDVVEMRTLGGTKYGDKPITLLTQDSVEITFEMSQEWTSDNLDYLFVRYRDTAFGSPTCHRFEGTNSTWKSDSLTAVCSKNSKIALVEVWASHSKFVSALDIATIPDCSCDTGDAELPIKNMVKYIFALECVTTCPSPSCSSSAPTVKAVDTAECVFDDSLNAVCEGNAIHAHDTITFASGEKTRVVGNIGVSSPANSITGEHEIKPGGKRLDSKQAGDFATTMWGTTGSYKDYYKDRDPSEYTDLGHTAVSEIGGMSFKPGIYVAEYAINFAYGTTITLDGGFDENAIFIFQAGTTLTTAADTFFILENGAKAKNVIWALGTAATLGARSILEGSILAGSSITFGTMSELRGCAIAQNAVTFESRGYVNVREQTGDDSACSNSNVGIGSCENFAVHARTTITFAGTAHPSVITNGDMGVSPGTAITGVAGTAYRFEGSGSIISGSSVFATSVMFDHADLRSRRSDEVYWGVGIYEIGGKTFGPGTYRVGEAINFAVGDPVILDGEGKENPTWLFQAGSTLVTAAGTYFELINGAKAENIIWALGTAATLGADSVVEGSVLAGTAITMGIKSQINGCAIAMTAVTFETEGFVSVPLLPTK
jgi:hypothetical protein